MEMPSAATSTDSRRATGERRTFEMKPTSQTWQAATERASVATVDSVLERELGFHRERLSVQLRVRIDEVVERIALLRWVEPDVSSDSKLQAIVVVRPEEIIPLVGMLPSF